MPERLIFKPEIKEEIEKETKPKDLVVLENELLEKVKQAETKFNKDEFRLVLTRLFEHDFEAGLTLLSQTTLPEEEFLSVLKNPRIVVKHLEVLENFIAETKRENVTSEALGKIEEQIQKTKQAIEKREEIPGLKSIEEEYERKSTPPLLQEMDEVYGEIFRHRKLSLKGEEPKTKPIEEELHLDEIKLKQAVDTISGKCDVNRLKYDLIHWQKIIKHLQDKQPKGFREVLREVLEASKEKNYEDIPISTRQSVIDPWILSKYLAEQGLSLTETEEHLEKIGEALKLAPEKWQELLEQHRTKLPDTNSNQAALKDDLETSVSQRTGKKIELVLGKKKEFELKEVEESEEKNRTPREFKNEASTLERYQEIVRKNTDEFVKRGMQLEGYENEEEFYKHIKEEIAKITGNLRKIKQIVNEVYLFQTLGILSARRGDDKKAFDCLEQAEDIILQETLHATPVYSIKGCTKTLCEIAENKIDIGFGVDLTKAKKLVSQAPPEEQQEINTLIKETEKACLEKQREFTASLAQDFKETPQKQEAKELFAPKINEITQKLMETYENTSLDIGKRIDALIGWFEVRQTLGQELSDDIFDRLYGHISDIGSDFQKQKAIDIFIKAKKFEQARNIMQLLSDPELQIDKIIELLRVEAEKCDPATLKEILAEIDARMGLLRARVPKLLDELEEIRKDNTNFLTRRISSRRQIEEIRRDDTKFLTLKAEVLAKANQPDNAIYFVSEAENAISNIKAPADKISLWAKLGETIIANEIKTGGGGEYFLRKAKELNVHEKIPIHYHLMEGLVNAELLDEAIELLDNKTIPQEEALEFSIKIIQKAKEKNQDIEKLFAKNTYRNLEMIKSLKQDIVSNIDSLDAENVDIDFHIGFHNLLDIVKIEYLLDSPEYKETLTVLERNLLRIGKEFVMPFEIHFGKLLAEMSQQEVSMEKKVVEKEIELTNDEKRKLELLNLLHQSEVFEKGQGAEQKQEYLEKAKAYQEKYQAKKPEPSSVWSEVIAGNIARILQKEPEKAFQTIAAKPTFFPSLQAKKLAYWLFPKKEEKATWQDFWQPIERGRPAIEFLAPGREDYLAEHEKSGLEGGNPEYGKDIEVCEIKGKVLEDFIETGSFSRYNPSTNQWEQGIPFEAEQEYGGGKVEFSIPAVNKLKTETIMLPEAVRGKIQMESIKLSDRKLKRQLEVNKREGGQIEVKITGELPQRKKLNLEYTARQLVHAPVIKEKLSAKDLERYCQQLDEGLRKDLSEQIIKLPIEIDMFLEDIKKQPILKQLTEIEKYLKSIFYYDFNNKEVAALKSGREMGERIVIMQERMEELRAKNPKLENKLRGKKYAGVCSDFTDMAAPVLRRAGFLAGVKEGFKVHGKKVVIGNAHSLNYVVLPDTKEKMQEFLIDTTPGGITAEERERLKDVSIENLLQRQQQAREEAQIETEKSKEQEEKIDEILEAPEKVSLETIKKLSKAERELALDRLSQKHRESIQAFVDDGIKRRHLFKEDEIRISLLKGLLEQIKNTKKLELTLQDKKILEPEALKAVKAEINEYMKQVLEPQEVSEAEEYLEKLI